MKYYLLAAILLVASLSSAMNIRQCLTTDNMVQVKLDAIRTTPELTISDANKLVTSQTFALPYRQASVRVNNVTWKEYDNTGTYLGLTKQVDPDQVYISGSFTFREMNGFTVNIKNQVSDNGTIKILDQIDYDLLGNDPIQLPTEVSPAFVGSYQKLADNYNTSYLRNLPLSRPSLLIISHTSLAPYISSFVAWKKSKGYDVYVANIQNIGTTAIALRDYILTQYNLHKCDHLLLLGDWNGSYPIPTNVYTSPDGTEHDADDNFLTMLAGNDYFPEMLSGRFSFGSQNELLVMLSKTISYEKTPYMANTNWMKRALVVAGNYAEGGLRPVTPVQTSKWLREKMLDKGYTTVDTCFYPPTLTGASAITASINQGVQYISYRGWGAADGWHYPAFHNQDLNSSMINYAKMPVVFSIVCNTGDFTNDLNPCFGEKWMRMGTIESLGGCIAFVGPSDLHTKTNLNNTISSGMFSEILDKGERDFGAVVLAGKVELYRNYPLDLASDGYVSFYYHVYNILSDPTLQIWEQIPSTIPASVVTSGTTFSPSDSQINIQAANLNGAIVSGTRDNVNFTYAKVHNGVAILPVNPEQTGNLTVTISKKDFVPLVTTLTPSLPAQVGITANSLNEQVINAGQTYQATLSLKNYTASTITDLAATLSASPDTLVSITNPTQTIASIAAGATETLTYSFTVSGDALRNSIITFSLAIPGQNPIRFEMLTGGPVFSVNSQYLGGLTIGSATTVNFVLTNIGNADMQNATVTIYSGTDAATIAAPTLVLGDIPVNQTAQVQASITVEAGCFVGRNIPLTFRVTDPAGYITDCFYNMSAGVPTAADPTGPDAYGYYAYDSHDTGYAQHPSYQWVEIDPRDGGSGDVHLIMDDGSYTVNLPFTFKYYGIDYDALTICSNGWASFVTTWMTDFNNLYIPAPLGPYAQVSPYWDDLKGMKTGEDSTGSFFNDMRICNWYDQTNNRYIVEWNDAYSNYTIDLMQDASLEKFQLILYPINGVDGDLVFQYHTIDNPAITSNYSTVGIENQLQNSGLLYSYANIYPASATHLQAGLAIKITKTKPDDFVVNDDQAASALPFRLGQNFPNPFSPVTTINFSVNTKEPVSLDIFNLKGEKIRTLHNGILSKGAHQLTWDGKDNLGKPAGSGVYFYKMIAGSHAQARKMILMR